MKRFCITAIFLLIALSIGLPAIIAAQYDLIVFQAQNVLKANGYDPGPVDGLWGASTESAIKHFQVDAEISVTGKLDELT